MTKNSLVRDKYGNSYLVPFIMVTSLFALWGFANDITNPMVAAFKGILLISNFESSLVQAAFYGGYCLMSIPAALYIRRAGYKRGILTGLALYACGCLLFIPAGNAMLFWAFLLAYFVMTCGLAFLETTSNPYILSMGDDATATRRLNLAQAFNPIGSLSGMLVAKEFILAKLKPFTEEQRVALRNVSPDLYSTLQKQELDIVSMPYLMLGGVVVLVFLLFFLVRLPNTNNRVEAATNAPCSNMDIFRRLLKNRVYVFSVIAQVFYVGVQIMVWTFIIQYAANELGMAKETAQGWNMLAMGIFVTSRFVCTFLLKYIRPAFLLSLLAVGGAAFVVGAIFLHGMVGLYCLVAVSACMSLMFPTIYGIALRGMGDDAKLASAGLILAIGGGCLMPPLQGLLIDKATWLPVLSSTRISFVLPLLCFVVIGLFGLWVSKRKQAE